LALRRIHRVRLPAGSFINRAHPDHELCIVVLSGTVTVRAGGDTWRDLGERKASSTTARLTPRLSARRRFRQRHAQSDAEVAMRARRNGCRTARVIEPGTMKRFARGVD